MSFKYFSMKPSMARLSEPWSYIWWHRIQRVTMFSSMPSPPWDRLMKCAFGKAYRLPQMMHRSPSLSHTRSFTFLVMSQAFALLDFGTMIPPFDSLFSGVTPDGDGKSQVIVFVRTVVVKYPHFHPFVEIEIGEMVTHLTATERTPLQFTHNYLHCCIRLSISACDLVSIPKALQSWMMLSMSLDICSVS